MIPAHDPAQTKALETLRRFTIAGSLRERLEASFWLWQATADAGAFLSLGTAGLAEGWPIGTETAERLGALGSLARPLGPALRRAILHPDFSTWRAAGYALLKVARELMPPARECK